MTPGEDGGGMLQSAQIAEDWLFAYAHASAVTQPRIWPHLAEAIEGLIAEVRRADTQQASDEPADKKPTP